MSGDMCVCGKMAGCIIKRLHKYESTSRCQHLIRHSRGADSQQVHSRVSTMGKACRHAFMYGWLLADTAYRLQRTKHSRVGSTRGTALQSEHLVPHDTAPRGFSQGIYHRIEVAFPGGVPFCRRPADAGKHLFWQPLHNR